tara:strand:- start:26 stop:493 length:468 start_codon:yes stop_codon:yes gene_type:complete
MPKPISQLIPDFREALKDGIKDAAENIVEGLIEDGPYWDGVFAASWEVKKGQRTITTYPVNMRSVKRGRTAKTKPEDVKFLLPAIPNNENLEGYTIGNMTRYRGYAMDLLPTPVGRKQGDALNKTARKDWYLRYVQGGRMQKRYDEAMINVFKKY